MSIKKIEMLFMVSDHMSTSINLWLIEIRSSQFHDRLGHYLSVKITPHHRAHHLSIYDDFYIHFIASGCQFFCDCEKIKKKSDSNTMNMKKFSEMLSSLTEACKNQVCKFHFRYNDIEKKMSYRDVLFGKRIF